MTKLSVAVARLGVSLAALALAIVPATSVAQFTPIPVFDPPARATGAWRSLDTEHFRFHYRAEFEAWTQAVAARMEAIRESVRAYVGYAPGQRVTILVDDPRNESNGNAYSWLDAPQIQLFPVPPAPRSLPSRDWGELLSVHEFAHIAHLTRPSRAPSRTRMVPFLGITGPLTMRLPRWAKEGYATVVEGALTGAGRPASAQRAAILRQFASEGMLPTYGAIDGASGFLGGSFAYLLGSAFLEHLIATHGDSTLPQLWRRVSARTVRSFGGAFEQTYGVRVDEAYARYVARLTANAVALEDALNAAGRVEGTLEARLTGNVGEPAVSPNGERMAITLADTGTSTGRVVIWPTAITPASERDSVRREAARRLTARDSLDVPPVPLVPRGKRVLASLSPSHGFAYRAPRFLHDNERLLVIRSGFVSDGSVLPDLYVWNSRTGDVRRVTRGAAVREADPFPDGTRAVGTRCAAGHCDLVMVNLSDGAVRTLRAGSAFVQYSRPRVSPRGDRIVASEHRDGRWRAVFVDPASGNVTPFGPDDGIHRYDFAWTRDGSAILGITEDDGVANVERIDIATGRRTPLTRVFSAANAPDAMPGDSVAFFLTLTARGYDVRRLSLTDSSAATLLPYPVRALLDNVRSGAVVTQWGSTMPLFDTRSVGAPRRYGLGPQRMQWLPFGGASIDGAYGGLALSGSDPNERFSWVVKYAANTDARVNAGAAARGIVRTPWMEIDVELDRTRLFGDRWTGGALSFSRSLVDALGTSGARVGIARHNVERTGEVSHTDGRTHLWGALGRTLRAGGPTRSLNVDLRGQASRTEGVLIGDAAGPTQHYVGLARFALAFGGPALVWEGSAGNSSRGEPFSVGGLGTHLMNAGVVPQVVAVPWLNAGALGGESYVRHVVGLSVEGVQPFVSAVRTDAGDWQRAAGVELRVEQSADGFARAPGVSVTAGAAWLFDSPNADRVRAWVGVSFRP